MTPTITTEEDLSCLYTSPDPPKTPSSVYSSISNDVKLVTDEWQASGEAELRYPQYDERGFLANFENTAAYTCPRPAPSPARGINPVLTAACLTPSSPPNRPLPLLPIRERPIAMSYDSTSPWSSGPPSSLPAGPVRLSQTYRNGYLDQYLDGKQPVKKRGRYNLQGYWLARGTLRGLVRQQPERGLDNDVQQHPENGLEVMVQKHERTKPTDGSGSSHPLWSRVRNSVRRSGTSARLSLLKGFEEFARAGERVGHIPAS